MPSDFLEIDGFGGVNGKYWQEYPFIVCFRQDSFIGHLFSYYKLMIPR